MEEFVCERELQTEQNCNILTSPAPPDIAVCRSRSPGLLNQGPGGTASLGYVLIPASSHQLVSKLYRRSRGPSDGWWLSLPQLVTNGSPKLTDFLSSLSYTIVQSSTQYLWNGMFDRHQAEITVMQFTGHSLPVHQSMTVHWDFNLSHIFSQACQRDFFS